MRFSAGVFSPTNLIVRNLLSLWFSRSQRTVEGGLRLLHAFGEAGFPDARLDGLNLDGSRVKVKLAIGGMAAGSVVGLLVGSHSK